MRSRSALSRLSYRRLVVPSILFLMVVAAALLRPGSTAERPIEGGLSPEATRRLQTLSAEIAPWVGLFASQADTLSLALCQTTPEDQEEGILEFAGFVSDWSDAFVAEYRALVQAAARVEGATLSSAQAHVARGVRHRSRPIRIPLSVSPNRLALLASPVPAQGPGGQAEQVLRSVLGRLATLLNRLPPGSRAARGLLTAIAAIRRILVAFDTEPVAITFTSPGEGLVTNSIPAIEFVMSDAGSGPDPGSRRLLAVNTGPVVQTTTDLTAFTIVSATDPSSGTVTIQTVGLSPSAIQDGYIRLEASGTDVANNPRTTAIRNFVLDRQGPVVTVTRPPDGGITFSATTGLEASLSDPVSGIDLASLVVTFNGTNITGTLSAEVTSLTSRGFPNQVRLTGSLDVVIGRNDLIIAVSDFASNSGQARVSFTGSVRDGGQLEPEPFPDIALEKVPPDDPHGGFEGGYPTATSATLKVRATNPQGSPAGIRLVARLIDGEGAVIPAPDRSLVTNGEGLAGFRVAFGRKSGPHTVEVTATNATVRDPLRFTVDAIPFDFVATIESDHMDGSGALVTIHSPQFVHVRVFESDGQGNPIPPSQGKLTFLDPEILTERGAGRTAVQFTGVAGFLIRPRAVGEYFVTAEAVGVTDENGRPVRRIVPDSIFQRGEQFLTHTRIESGQGQRAYPGKETLEPLAARLVPGTRPDLEPNPPDRIVFTISTDSQPRYESQFLPGTLLPVVGSDPIQVSPTRLSLKAVNGVASVRFKPQMPISAIITIAAERSPQPLVPNDFFIVGGPRAYLARKNFARDGAGRIVRDSQGNATPTDEFEEIPSKDREPFVRVADILSYYSRK